MLFTRRNVLAGAGTCALGLAGPGILRAQDAGPEIKSIALGFGIDPPFAPHIVAIEKGWFKEAGFSDVATESFTSGNLAGEALMAGQIHLWTPGNLPPISMAANGIPIVVLGTNCVNWNLEKLVAREDAGVTTPEDLYDIRIGLIQGSTSNAFMYYLARHYGLDEQRFQIVNLAPPEQLAAFTSGDIQAFVCWEPWPYRALQAVPSKVAHSGLFSGFEANEGERVKVSNNRSLWVASQDFARRNPNATRAITKTLVRAQHYVADPQNKDEVIQLFSAFQNQDVALNQAIWDGYVFDATFDEAYVEDMNRTAAYLLAAGRIRKEVDPLSFSHTSLLREIDPELVKIEGGWQA